MFWVVQENLFNEPEYESLLQCLERLEIPHQVVKVAPFSLDAPEEEQLYPNIYPDGEVMICGSITLAKIGAKRNWHPGSFVNDNHDYRVWQKFYGDHLLNPGCTVCRFADVTKTLDEFFIRPCEDDKTFTGKVMTWDEFEEWRTKVLTVGYFTLDADTMVSYGPVKEIYNETRFFIVDGKISGQSVYKRGNKLKKPDPHVDDGAIEFVKQMIEIWVPARAFVIDVAWTPDGYKIIEINCINSSGFYAINVYDFVTASEDMKLDMKLEK